MIYNSKNNLIIYKTEFYRIWILCAMSYYPTSYMKSFEIDKVNCKSHLPCSFNLELSLRNSFPKEFPTLSWSLLWFFFCRGGKKRLKYHFLNLKKKEEWEKGKTVSLINDFLLAWKFSIITMYLFYNEWNTLRMINYVWDFAAVGLKWFRLVIPRVWLHHLWNYGPDIFFAVCCCIL